MRNFEIVWASSLQHGFRSCGIQKRNRNIVMFIECIEADPDFAIAAVKVHKHPRVVIERGRSRPGAALCPNRHLARESL